MARTGSAGGAGKTPALDQFTTCLTQRARDGKLDPVIGRDPEIRQAIDILMRRRQNNPILTGEAGVGKTAVVEGLALRIASGDVPDVLRGVEIHTLDMGLLQAGASVKGEFENRLKNVIDEVKKSPHAIILFIDEAHTMIGAGGAAGQNDAANLLKPALARGELRTIAATTWGEYKKYFEKDAALARRFQVVKVEEPDEETACAMLRGDGAADGEALRRARLRRSDHRGGAPVAPLHQRPPAAGQGDQRARYRLRQGGAGPERDAGAGREPACACSNGSTREVAALEREESAGADHAARLAMLRAERVGAADEQRSAAARAGSRSRRSDAEIKRLRSAAGSRAAQGDSRPRCAA